MKRTAFLGLMIAAATMMTILGCGQATVGKYSGQGVLTLNGKTSQQPVIVDISERLYKDYDANYTLQSSSYQGTLQIKQSEGKLQGRSIFTYSKAGAKVTDPVLSCDVELTGTFEIVEDTMNGKLCGKDFGCSNGSDVCIEFKGLKRSTATQKNQADWWSPTTTTLPTGVNRL